jgi:hypothetical protein
MSSFALLNRFALRLLALALPLIAVPAIHASAVTYQIALTSSSGVDSGTGTLTLASQPAATGTSTYTIANQQLQNLAFTIDDQSFYLSGDPDASVTFVDGRLTKINFLQSVSHPPSRYTLELSNGFIFYGNNFGHPLSFGSFNAAPAITFPDETISTPQSAAASPTPEPGSLFLLATALAAGVFFLFRRRRAAHS